MANEITDTSLASFTNSSLVQPVVILALTEQPGLAIQMCREFNAVGQPTTAIKIPTQTSYWGTPGDHGAGVATAFNGTEAVGLGNTPVAAGGVTITPTEYGVAHALTDNVSEDSAIDAMQLMQLFTTTMLNVLKLALDDDYIALYASLPNTSGVTNTTLTAPTMLNAQQSVRIRGTNAASVAYVIDNKQSQDLESNLISSSTSIAVYAMSADRLIGYNATPGNGMGPGREIMQFRNYPVYSTGLTDNANGTTDVVGACICPTSAYNDASGATTHALAWKRLPRFETQRQAKGRSIDLVMVMRAGVGTLQPGSGQLILSKA